MQTASQQSTVASVESQRKAVYYQSAIRKLQRALGDVQIASGIGKTSRREGRANLAIRLAIQTLSDPAEKD